MMRKFSILLATAIFAVGLSLPQAAYAASSTHARIVTLIASNQWIIYKQKVTSSNMRPDSYTGGTVYATDVTGQRVDLPGFNNDKQPLFLTGSIVAQAQNTLHSTLEKQTVKWLNLNNNESGSFTGMANEILVGAGPNGFLMESRTGDTGVYGDVSTLTYVHLDGTRQNIGVPYPQGQDFGVTVSDTGIITTPGVSDESSFRSQVKYQAWSDLTTSWRTIFTAGYNQVGISCAPSSTTYVACFRSPEEGEGEGPAGYGLISLNGSGAHWLYTSHPKACMLINFATFGSNLVAVETSDAGVCTKGKLYRFNWDGTLISGGSHHYSSTGILTGLGGVNGGSSKIIVSSLDQRHIDTLTGVTRAPHVLVHV